MSSHDESLGPEGYQVDAVEAWIAEHIPELTPPFEWTRLEGGHSNLTYRLDDSNGGQAVIRRPPQSLRSPQGKHGPDRSKSTPPASCWPHHSELRIQLWKPNPHHLV